VGYQIRLDSRPPNACYQQTLTLCTTGVLFRYLASDADLTGVTHIFVDEIHERDILSDFALIVLKQLLARRPDLKLILMSATLKASIFSEYFGGCPMLEVGFAVNFWAHILCM
jgi:HrpA-like RNA helicase